ncbi:hypothetical protein B0J12DRAFT_670786 [Macrophomina phaseolina]|uniref:Uncharacterized protein n=1 Tax=Macrophomina phaseolina TaxID=35725 RepID=A0ABQ8G4M4_9PEZI|nr:hypothetical protein B0J12DRAFT_670786 [Macrophomina phaseolina]
MRIALDERSVRYKDKADPFYVAGFFHLYCFEKFLDLPFICTLHNVEVRADTRTMPNEPNHKWGASLTEAKEGVVAQRFIESCRKGRSHIRDFDNYPRPGTLAPGAEWPYNLTLSYRMQAIKEGDRARSSKQSLSKRPQRPTQVNVNLGDLAMACSAKAAMRKPQPAPKLRQKRSRKRRASWFDQEDSDYVSEMEEHDDSGFALRISKRPRRDHNNAGSSIAAPAHAHQQAIRPAVSQLAPQASNGADASDTSMTQDLQTYLDRQNAWPQYTSGSDPSATGAAATSTVANALTTSSALEISTALRNAYPSLFVDPALNVHQPQPVPDYPPDGFAPPAPSCSSSHPQPLSSLPDYPPDTFTAPAPATPSRSHRTKPTPAITTTAQTIHRELPVPNSFSLNAAFALSNPKSKRPRADGDNGENADAPPPSKRGRFSSTSASASAAPAEPLSSISANVPSSREVSPKSRTVSTLSVETPRSRSEKSGLSDMTRKRSLRLSGGSGDSGSWGSWGVDLMGRSSASSEDVVGGRRRRSRRLSGQVATAVAVKGMRESDSGESFGSLGSLGSLFGAER